MYVIFAIEPEEFKICTYPGIQKDCYMISNYGSIKRIDTGKLLTLNAINSSGYRHSVLCGQKYKKYRNILVHRLVAWEFVQGYTDERNHVNHKDSNKLNNYFENLEWVTPGDNQIHAYTHGHKKPSIPNNKGPRPMISGSSNPNNKFSEPFVREICGLMEQGYTTKEILHINNATKKSNSQLYTLLMNLKHRKSWNDVTREYNY